MSDDARCADYIRDTADSLYHAVGTCAMGADPPASQRPSCAFEAIDALRVVDASVMPLVPSGNTTAAVLMIAERAADLIVGGVEGETELTD